MLEARGLSKSFGARKAVDRVSFTAAAGRTLGLLGPNGAGKSTLVNMIAGVLAPDEGSVLVNGSAIDPSAGPARRLVGFVPQDVALYEELTALENLRLFGALYGLSPAVLRERAREALRVVCLEERGAERVESFSGGMRRRLNIAAALLHEPRLLLLDEPTVGVDPQSRNAIFDTLGELRQRGLALVYTTHYMEEAERLCDRIIILDHGRVLADDTLAGLQARFPAAAPAPRPEPRPATLESVFLELTGRNLRDT